MIDKFRYWYYRNSTQITWFLIGFLVSSGIDQLRRGNLSGATISFAFAALNYVLFVRR